MVYIPVHRGFHTWGLQCFPSYYHYFIPCNPTQLCKKKKLSCLHLICHHGVLISPTPKLPPSLHLPPSPPLSPAPISLSLSYTHTSMGAQPWKAKTTRSKSQKCRCQVVPLDSSLTPSRGLAGPWKGTDLGRRAESLVTMAPPLLINLLKEEQCYDSTQLPPAPRKYTQLLFRRELWTCFAEESLWSNVIKFGCCKPEAFSLFYFLRSSSLHTLNCYLNPGVWNIWAEVK